MQTIFPRRSFLRGAVTATGLGLGLGLGVTSCTFPSDNPIPSGAPSPLEAPRTESNRPPGPRRVLLAYFSRAGENYYYGDRTWLERGNTEVVAQMIAEAIEIDTFRIEAAEPYPEVYEPTVERNRAEQQTDTRPAIRGNLPNLDDYDVILLGSGVWSVGIPMIMRTFVENYDLAGKTIHPLVTYAVSGMDRVVEDYEQSCPGAQIGEGLAIQGEEAEAARPEINRWVQSIGLVAA